MENKVEYERIRQSGRDRYKDLSRPKEQKIEWWTNVGPNVMWGTQEMMWPVSRSIPDATDRVKTLASPKKNFQTGKFRKTTVLLQLWTFIYGMGAETSTATGKC